MSARRDAAPRLWGNRLIVAHAVGFMLAGVKEDLQPASVSLAEEVGWKDER